MMVAYIAGPIYAPTAHEMEKNIRRGEDAALWTWAHGMAAICPHSFSRFINGALPDAVFIKGNLVLIDRCDLVLFTLGWERSKGASEEYVHCQQTNKIMFNFPDDHDEILEWLQDEPEQAAQGSKRLVHRPECNFTLGEQCICIV